MPSVHFELARAHPSPFLWNEVPPNARIPLDRVAGRIDDAGSRHNTFLNLFNGHQIPPKQLQSVNLHQEDRAAVDELMMEVFGLQRLRHPRFPPRQLQRPSRPFGRLSPRIRGHHRLVPPRSSCHSAFGDPATKTP